MLLQDQGVIPKPLLNSSYFKILANYLPTKTHQFLCLCYEYTLFKQTFQEQPLYYISVVTHRMLSQDQGVIP